jgi:hypothetical protein
MISLLLWDFINFYVIWYCKLLYNVEYTFTYLICEVDFVYLSTLLCQVAKYTSISLVCQVHIIAKLWTPHGQITNSMSPMLHANLPSPFYHRIVQSFFNLFNAKNLFLSHPNFSLKKKRLPKFLKIA